MELVENNWVEQRMYKPSQQHRYAVWFDPRCAQALTYRGKEPRIMGLPDGHRMYDERRPLKAHMIDWMREHLGDEGSRWRWSMNFRFVSFRDKADADRFFAWWNMKEEDFYNGIIALVQPMPKEKDSGSNGDPMRRQRRN